VDAARVSILREMLAGTGWVERTRSFGKALRTAPHQAGGLLVVGTPTEEPWHLTAHLDDEARYAGIPTLAPTLVRWSPPRGAPAHLAVGLDRLERAGRGETLFVVAPDVAPDPLLERIANARRIGATIFAIEGEDDEPTELAGLAHESLLVPMNPASRLSTTARAGLVVPDIDVISHLVSTAAGEHGSATGDRARLSRMRRRLSKLLDAAGD
jgi:hypothetical protein